MPDNLRILVATQFYPPEITACAFRVAETAQSWVKMGAEVTVLTTYPNMPGSEKSGGQLPHIEEVEGVRVVRTWTTPIIGHGIAIRTLNHFSYLVNGRTTLGNRFGGFDVVMGTSPSLFAAELAAQLADRYSAPFVMEIRDLWPDLIFDHGYGRLGFLKNTLYRWEKSLYNRASHLVTVTPSFIPLLEKKGISRDKITIIPPGVLFDTIGREVHSNLRQELKLSGKYVVLYLGNHGECQGLDAVVDAASHAGEDVHFLFVGDGWFKPKLMEQAGELELKNISFLPAIPRHMTGMFYQAADACLVPLKPTEFLQNFLPSKLLEIMAEGKPVLTNIGGEGARLVTESGGGKVMEFKPEALGKELSRWAGERDKWKECGARGREYIRERYDRHILAGEYLDTLKRVVDQGRK